jgi:hypothetical protein
MSHAATTTNRLTDADTLIRTDAVAAARDDGHVPAQLAGSAASGTGHGRGGQALARGRGGEVVEQDVDALHRVIPLRFSQFCSQLNVAQAGRPGAARKEHQCKAPAVQKAESEPNSPENCGRCPLVTPENTAGPPRHHSALITAVWPGWLRRCRGEMAKSLRHWQGGQIFRQSLLLQVGTAMSLEHNTRVRSIDSVRKFINQWTVPQHADRTHWGSQCRSVCIALGCSDSDCSLACHLVVHFKEAQLDDLNLIHATAVPRQCRLCSETHCSQLTTAVPAVPLARHCSDCSDDFSCCGILP